MSIKRYLFPLASFVFVATLTTGAYANPDIAPQLYTDDDGVAIADEPTSWIHTMLKSACQ